MVRRKSILLRRRWHSRLVSSLAAANSSRSCFTKCYLILEAITDATTRRSGENTIHLTQGRDIILQLNMEKRHIFRRFLYRPCYHHVALVLTHNPRYRTASKSLACASFTFSTRTRHGHRPYQGVPLPKTQWNQHNMRPQMFQALVSLSRGTSRAQRESPVEQSVSAENVGNHLS